MNDNDNAIIRFDDDGNLDLFGHDRALAKWFNSSEKTLALQLVLSDFDMFAKCCPDMVTILQETFSSGTEYVADLPAVTQRLMEEGKLLLRPGKDGKLLAQFINADNSRIDSIVRLKEIQRVPAVNDMMFSLNFMAIPQPLNQIQEDITDLRQGQIHDRERAGLEAAQYLQWASNETDLEKRSDYCLKAHDAAVTGFFECLNTVEESAGYLLSLPTATTALSAFLTLASPLNWEKTGSAIAKNGPERDELRRAVSKCAYCTEYAAAASLMRGDKHQATLDFEMYAEHMRRELLGSKEKRLRGWISSETIPPVLKRFAENPASTVDVLSSVESSISMIEGLPHDPLVLDDGQPNDTDNDNNLEER